MSYSLHCLSSTSFGLEGVKKSRKSEDPKDFVLGRSTATDKLKEAFLNWFWNFVVMVESTTLGNVKACKKYCLQKKSSMTFAEQSNCILTINRVSQLIQGPGLAFNYPSCLYHCSYQRHQKEMTELLWCLLFTFFYITKIHNIITMRSFLTL